MHSMATWALAACLGLALASAGCSFSTSSASISDSITGSSESVSDSLSSSSPDGSSKSEQAYREDVRDYTASAARSGRGGADFQGGLARVAELHGVTNWEADTATFVGIGEGLRRAGVAPAALADWAGRVGPSSGSRVQAERLIQQGYDATHS